MSRVHEAGQDDSFSIIAGANFLISRLEHLSADSVYAHQASGIRGSMLRCLAEIEPGKDRTGEPLTAALVRLGQLMDLGYSILVKAAREIPETK